MVYLVTSIAGAAASLLVIVPINTLKIGMFIFLLNTYVYDVRITFEVPLGARPGWDFQLWILNTLLQTTFTGTTFCGRNVFSLCQ